MADEVKVALHEKALVESGERLVNSETYAAGSQDAANHAQSVVAHAALAEFYKNAPEPVVEAEAAEEAPEAAAETVEEKPAKKPARRKTKG